MTTTITNQREAEQEARGFGSQLPFESISEPGAYICNWSGHLLRVPDDSIKPGRSPVISLRGNMPLHVTKISDNPFVPVSKARLLTADCDLMANF
ncbi:MAG TPA: hypothetical protein VM118_01755 [Acidobacteriota bacterium]|nr:hypothetical protein [Acidobacteriota bacterium]